MQKCVCSILSCAMVLLLSLGSCKTESKSDSVDALEENEQLSPIETLDKAIADLEDACKAGDRDAALTAYEVVLRIILKKTVANTYEGIYTMSSVLTPEQEKKLDALSDCECLSNEDLLEISERVEAEY